MNTPAFLKSFALHMLLPLTRTTSLLLHCLKILTFFEHRLFLKRYLHYLEAVYGTQTYAIAAVSNDFRLLFLLQAQAPLPHSY